jgi:hypothetical protein
MSDNNPVMVTPEIGVINDSGEDLNIVQVLTAGREQNPQFAELLPEREFAEIVKWTTNTQGGSGRLRRGSIFDRDRFISPDNVFDKMRVAEEAISDDVVASFLDSSEALAFSRIGIECDDEDEQDIWEQISDDIDLDSRMHEVWRELNVYSMSYVAVWYGTKSYKVRGKSDGGTQRKKAYNNLTVPLGVTTLDPFKVIPVGNYLFNAETLCYYADPTERDIIDSWLLGDDDSGADQIIQRLIVGKYEPDFRDRKEIGNLGIDPNRLYIMNPKYVWRLTATKSGWKRFPDIRMESVFEILDLKHQLRQMDRANLIGASNFILLIKKGTDEMPAKPYEIGALQEQVRTISKVPVIVGDHRLSIEIITPKTDNTLDAKRYEGLDIRISGRLYGMFISIGAGRDDSLKLARVVARGLESRRAVQRSAFVKNIFMPTFELNDTLKAEPDMVFHPKNIALDFDPSRATYLLDLRDRGDLSRQSVLSEVDYDEGEEAAKRTVEKAKYDKAFQLPLPSVPPAPATVPEPTKSKQVALKPPAPVKIPLPGPVPGAPNDPKRAGRSQGGNHGKGGNGNIGRGAGLPSQTGNVTKTKPAVVRPQKRSPNTQPAEDGLEDE